MGIKIIPTSWWWCKDCTRKWSHPVSWLSMSSVYWLLLNVCLQPKLSPWTWTGQNWLLNCLLDISPCKPNRHLQLNMFKTELSIFPLKSSPPTLYTISVMASTLPVALAKTLGLSMIPLFLSHSISKTLEEPLGSTFKICAESHSYHAGPSHHPFSLD